MVRTPFIHRILPREISGFNFQSSLSSIGSKGIQVFYQLTPATQLAKTDHLLGIAGNPGGLRAGGYLALQVLFFIVGALIATYVVTSTKPIDFFAVAFGSI